MDVRPFKVQIPPAVLADLRQRLARTRWPDEIPASAWDYGANLSYMKKLVDHWQNRFNWRVHEDAINRFRHFRAVVDGLGIHFVHERGKGPGPFPIIITHGWPGSFLEMLKLIPLLTDPESYGADPADAFDVVVPSLPGYGFSDRPAERGVNTWRIAEMWDKLMAGLGYGRFGAQGGDWGASVSTLLALKSPDHVAGLHLNYIPEELRPYQGVIADDLTRKEQEFLDEAERWAATEGGYSHIQRTRPQTLAYAMNDSPAGMAAWIVEKFRDWSDCDGKVEKHFTKDELLTNLTVYWATETFLSAARLYYEAKKAPVQFKRNDFVKVPTGIARFPVEAPFPPRRWVERCYNVQRWTDMPSGGHFPALEEPELLAKDIREFFRPLRGSS
jgi:pimeloyl-ACP methyl ester carboxylesterase